MAGPDHPSPQPAHGGTNPAPGTQLRGFWERHRALFWNLHSIWALAAGGMVVFFADERYGFVPWVVLFLVLTWGSTLFFSRAILRADRSSRRDGPPQLHREVASYLTRIMYQGTLFFLLPFYWYSTVVQSLNVGFSLLLVFLAVVSCLDLIFDRWLRTHAWFGLVFFGTVTFAAINLLLPLLFPLDPSRAILLAAVLALGSALPLAVRGPGRRLSGWLPSVLLGLLSLLLAVGFPQLIPPVPLRVKSITFTSDLNRSTLVAADSLKMKVRSRRLKGELFILVEVFSPSVLPTTVSFEWTRNAKLIRTSRTIDIVAHAWGFRIWDGYIGTGGRVPPGEYQVTLRTAGQRCFGVARITVSAD